MDQRPLQRVWVGYFHFHRTLKVPSSINKPVPGSKMMGKTERQKARNFEIWLASENFLLHQLRANRRILDRVRFMLWIFYRNFSFHHAIQFRPVERIATTSLPHSKRLDKTFPLQSTAKLNSSVS